MKGKLSIKLTANIPGRGSPRGSPEKKPLSLYLRKIWASVPLEAEPESFAPPTYHYPCPVKEMGKAE